MKIMKNRLLIGLQLAILLILVMGCTTLIPDNNMKWTAQYNFMDLYKKRNHGFNPGSDKQLSLVFSPMENVIILGAQKNTPNFDPTATEGKRYSISLQIEGNPTRNSFLKEMMSMILHPIRKSIVLLRLLEIKINMYISLIIRLFS